MIGKLIMELFIGLQRDINGGLKTSKEKKNTVLPIYLMLPSSRFIFFSTKKLSLALVLVKEFQAKTFFLFFFC